MTASESIPARYVLAVVADLLFRSKIDDVVRRLALDLRVAKSIAQLDRHLASGEPAIALVDLEIDTMNAADAIRRLRECSGGEQLRIIAFASHTNVEAIQAGRAAGAGVVLARSAFVAQLSAALTHVAAEQDSHTS